MWHTRIFGGRIGHVAAVRMAVKMADASQVIGAAAGCARGNGLAERGRGRHEAARRALRRVGGGR